MITDFFEWRKSEVLVTRRLEWSGSTRRLLSLLGWWAVSSWATSWAASGATSVTTSSWAASIAASSVATASASAVTATSTASASSLVATASHHSLHLLLVVDESSGVLDEWRWDSVSLWPQVWRKHGVGLLEAGVGGSAEVLSGTGLTDATGVDVIDTGELKNLLGDVGSNATSTSWGWDHSDGTGAALSLNLGWNGMNVTDSGTPVTSSNWDHAELGIDEGALDGNLDFLADLDTDTDVSVSITNSADSLESGSLTGLGLLLNGEDAHDVIGEDFLEGLALMLVHEEGVDDLGFLDWDGSGVDFFEGLDLSHLDESTQLGEWHPVLALAETATASWAATSATTASIAASAAASSEASSASALTTGWWSVTCWWRLRWCCCVHA